MRKRLSDAQVCRLAGGAPRHECVPTTVHENSPIFAAKTGLFPLGRKITATFFGPKRPKGDPVLGSWTVP